MTFKVLVRIDRSETSLPAALAGLPEAAVNDARKLDRAIYTPHREQWQRSIPSPGGPFCEVCLGGSLIAGTLAVESCDSVTASMFDDRTSMLLDALDDMRIGTGSARSNASTTAICHRRGHPVDPPEFIQNLINATFANEEPISEELAINFTLMLIWAGHETTAGQLAWTLIDLLQHPDYYVNC